MGNMNWWNDMPMHDDGAGIGLWLLLLLVAGAVIWYWLTPHPGRAPGRAPGRDAEQVLRDRFARGEIDAEEYRSRLRTLRDGTAPQDDPGQVRGHP
ncbi:SHOCT domain-containing protein [Spongisporangium articulatum]|uniref:SHOCT domain-containing protein n=1 Tax=Spongisporangium articulatum TaxID=3362603 RepID=A0ABW8AP39_9ACTN